MNDASLSSHFGSPQSSTSRPTARTMDTKDHKALKEFVQKKIRTILSKEWWDFVINVNNMANDHASTLYSCANLCPSFKSFLNSRGRELPKILERRPAVKPRIFCGTERPANAIPQPPERSPVPRRDDEKELDSLLLALFPNDKNFKRKGGSVLFKNQAARSPKNPVGRTKGPVGRPRKHPTKREVIPNDDAKNGLVLNDSLDQATRVTDVLRSEVPTDDKGTVSNDKMSEEVSRESSGSTSTSTKKVKKFVKVKRMKYFITDKCGSSTGAKKRKKFRLEDETPDLSVEMIKKFKIKKCNVALESVNFEKYLIPPGDVEGKPDEGTVEVTTASVSNDGPTLSDVGPQAPVTSVAEAQVQAAPDAGTNFPFIRDVASIRDEDFPSVNNPEEVESTSLSTVEKIPTEQVINQDVQNNPDPTKETVTNQEAEKDASAASMEDNSVPENRLEGSNEESTEELCTLKPESTSKHLMELTAEMQTTDGKSLKADHENTANISKPKINQNIKEAVPSALLECLSKQEHDLLLEKAANNVENENISEGELKVGPDSSANLDSESSVDPILKQKLNPEAKLKNLLEIENGNSAEHETFGDCSSKLELLQGAEQEVSNFNDKCTKEEPILESKCSGELELVSRRKSADFISPLMDLKTERRTSVDHISTQELKPEIKNMYCHGGIVPLGKSGFDKKLSFKSKAKELLLTPKKESNYKNGLQPLVSCAEEGSEVDTDGNSRNRGDSEKKSISETVTKIANDHETLESPNSTKENHTKQKSKSISPASSPKNSDETATININKNPLIVDDKVNGLTKILCDYGRVKEDSNMSWEEENADIVNEMPNKDTDSEDSNPVKTLPLKEVSNISLDKKNEVNILPNHEISSKRNGSFDDSEIVKRPRIEVDLKEMKFSSEYSCAYCETKFDSKKDWILHYNNDVPKCTPNLKMSWDNTEDNVATVT